MKNVRDFIAGALATAGILTVFVSAIGLVIYMLVQVTKYWLTR